MYPGLSKAERAGLIARYRLLPTDQAVDILDSPQAVQANGCPPQAFSLDQVVSFHKPTTAYGKAPEVVEGIIGLFVRRQDEPTSPPSAVIITADHRTYRIPLPSLSTIDHQSPPGTESTP